MLSSIKYSKNKMTQTLKIGSILLLLYLLPACDLSDSENYNQVVIDSTSVYLVNIENDRTTKIIDGENPMFIPNTNKILYRDVDKIYSLDLITTENKYISDMPGSSLHLYKKMYLSKNGHYVSFSANGGNHNNDLYLASTITGGSVNVTNSPLRWESEGIFFNNDSKLMYSEFVSDEKGNLKYYGISIIELFGNNFVFLDSNKSPIGFSQDERYAVFSYSWSSSTSKGTIFYIYDMFNSSIQDTILVENVDTFNGPSLSNDMKVYYSANESNIYRLDLVTKDMNLLWSGTTSRDYKFSPDFKMVLVNHGNYLELINLETSQSKNYFLNESSKIYFGEPCFSEDGKSFLIARSYHDEYFN
ncbi:MAG TPA: hypothetical protein DHV28_03155 [Ignavibacteriales bacterium]|nr:hypothetical protein [Ignavibacteriales bacterium]